MPSIWVCLCSPHCRVNTYLFYERYSIIADCYSITMTNAHNYSHPEACICPCRCFLCSLEPSKVTRAATKTSLHLVPILGSAEMAKRTPLKTLYRKTAMGWVIKLPFCGQTGFGGRDCSSVKTTYLFMPF